MSKDIEQLKDMIAGILVNLQVVIMKQEGLMDILLANGYISEEQRKMILEDVYDELTDYSQGKDI